jgi:hypothetical protein
MRLALIGIFTIFGLIVLGVLALLAFDTVIAYRVTCTRSTDTCVLEQKRATNTSTTTVPLHSLRSATLDLRRGGRRQGQRVLLMLVASDQRYFAAEYEGWDAQEDAETAVRGINTFFAGSTPQTLRLHVTNPVLYAAGWIGGVLCLVLLIGGGIAILRRVGREPPLG